MTKYLVMSDIHQDDRGLATLLKNAREYDEIWCLGDVVGHEDYVEHKYPGYKGNAQICYEMLRHWNAQCIIGNWEGWLLQAEKDNDTLAHQHKYIHELQQARSVLLENGITEWIRTTWHLSLAFDVFTLVHGSIDNDGDKSTEMWETYIRPKDIDLVNRIFLYEKLNAPHMLYGHTHIPGYFTYNGQNMPEWQSIKKSDLLQKFEYNIYDHALHFVINPGSLNLNRNQRDSDFCSDPTGTVLEIDTKEQIFRYLPIFTE